MLFIKLETVKSNKWILKAFGHLATRYTVNDLYGRPENAGYTHSKMDAGVWSLYQAYKNMGHCGTEKRLVFEVEGVRFEDVALSLKTNKFIPAKKPKLPKLKSPNCSKRCIQCGKFFSTPCQYDEHCDLCVRRDRV